MEIADSSHELSFNREKELILQKQILVCDLESKLILIKRGIGYGFICPSHIKNELIKQELVAVPVEIPKDDQFVWLAWHPSSKGGNFYTSRYCAFRYSKTHSLQYSLRC